MSSARPLQERTEALARAVVLSRGRHPDEVVNAAAVVVTKSEERIRHGSNHTVVALVGPTGSGKSSVFNALAGSEVSEIGVRRPTTSQTHASAWSDEAGPLLDWLEIKRRHQPPPNPAFDGLILLDLPDFDSTEASNRMEVDRLVELVDLLVWVVEPQKYADQALHEGYLRPLSNHDDVMRFVLSKVDTLTPDERPRVVPDLIRLLAEDGLEDPVVVSVSALTGEGIDDLWSVLSAAAGDRRAMVDRLSADIDDAAITLSVGLETDRSGVPKQARADLIEGLGRAAGVDAAASVVAKQYRRDATLATGWPPTRWIRRFRGTPMADLPLPGRSSVAQAEIGAALRRVGDATADGLGQPWEMSVRRVALDCAPDVQTKLGTVTAHAARAQRDRPTWWAAVRALQRVAGLVAVAGLVWLVALAVVGGLLRLDTDPLTPMAWDWMPVPSLLLLGGALVGILLALLSRLPARVGAKRRARRVRSQLGKELGAVADAQVIAPLEHALDQRRELAQVLSLARR